MVGSVVVSFSAVPSLISIMIFSALSSSDLGAWSIREPSSGFTMKLSGSSWCAI